METKETEKILESKAQIRFQDCDPFNHLNNSRYMDYIINAREDQLIEHYELNIYQMTKETGISWVVSQTQISYLFPVELMEKVTIQTKLISFNNKKLLVEGIMWNENKTQIKAITWLQFTHFNLRTRKSHPHSEELMQFFSEIVLPIQEKSFEVRLKNLNN